MGFGLVSLLRRSRLVAKLDELLGHGQLHDVIAKVTRKTEKRMEERGSITKLTPFDYC